jgi:hypothetical protein
MTCLLSCCDELYVMRTNCTDNWPKEGLEKFLDAASKTPGELLPLLYIDRCIASGDCLSRYDGFCGVRAK